jgi:hypothetical protein
MAKFVGFYKQLGWTGELPFYQFYCEVCKKTVINYPHTHKEKLICPICLEREKLSFEEHEKIQKNYIKIVAEKIKNAF